jgi:hypothetical protein
VRLEDVTAELRPRSDWEAVDLGLALARRDFWRLFGAWWLGMAPVVILCFAFLRDYPVLLLLACWWWVPVGSRLVLFVVSRHLFGELPGWKAVFREWPRAIFRRFFFRMIWARFSPWRPLTMAVEDLEGLRGKDYAQRVRLLLRRGDATVVALAIWRLGLTFWLAGAIFGTEMLFLPRQTAEEWWVAIDTWREESWFQLPPTLGWSVTVALLLSMSLVDVFSTGAGFGIYVNHRTWIEGWDVELAFRRLANRLRAAGSVFLAALFLWLGSPVADAAPSPKETIEEVKAHEDFTVHRVKEKVPSSSGSGASNAPLGFLATLAQVVFFLIVGAALAFIAWLIWRFRHLLRPAGFQRGAKRVPPQARVVMGLDVAPESLPPDIPAAAMELWRVGRRQEAMSLLYRGAISRLIDGSGVEIAESDTESDCVRRVAAEAAPHAAYFGGLTEAWMRLAYGRTTPADETMSDLCARWPFSERRLA